MEEAVAQVLRVVGTDTLQCRAWCPLMQARATVYCVICGVECNGSAPRSVIDWVEIHADGDRLKLVTFDFMRDKYGRLLIDLADLQSGECLSEWLVTSGVATPNPNHLTDVFREMLASEEPDDAGW